MGNDNKPVKRRSVSKARLFREIEAAVTAHQLGEDDSILALKELFNF